MATATPRFGPPVPPPLVGITLDLSVEEALALKRIVQRYAGSEGDDRVAGRILGALNFAVTTDSNRPF